jgi:carbon-monoxide dehydrogenase large subunit
MNEASRPVFRGRTEDLRFLTGRGRYVDGLPENGALFGHLLRSPIAHGRITALDVSAAAAMAGVALVLTSADLVAEGIGPLPCPTQPPTLEPIRVPPRPLLAHDVVRHVGDPVAFVVAEHPALARDAAEAIEVAFEELPALADVVSAGAPDAPQLWPQAPGNLAFRFQRGDRTAVSAAFASASAVVELDLQNNRVIASAMEPRTAIGRYDAASATFDLILSGQGVHEMREQLARDVLRVPADRVHLSAPDVGGGFGPKNVLHPEYALLLVAARRLGRPVRWTAERSEDFLSTVQAREQRSKARLALDAGGRFLGLEVETDADLGAYLSSGAPLVPTMTVASCIQGVYAIPAVFLEVRGLYTNTVPIDAYRGAGKPEGNYVIERLVGLAARRLGLAQDEIRRRNIVAAFPHTTALGWQIERGAFVDNIIEATRLAGREAFEARRAEASARGRLRGQGLACFLETARGRPGEWAGIGFEQDGTVTIRIGTQSNGQGHETTFPQIASARLGLPTDRFWFVQADTRRVPRGYGHGGARSMHQGGTALVHAIDGLLAKARRLAAQLLQADEASLVFADGAFATPDGSARVDLDALAEAARDPEQLPPGMAPGLACEVDVAQDAITYPNGCHVAEVEIDPDTGEVILESYLAVDDFGRLIDPVLTEGQVQGGVAQGIGQAMLERTVYEPGSAQLITASFMDYCLPRAADLPELEVRFNGVPSAGNPLGVKGSGQAGAIAAPQTIIDAILDALAPLGIETFDMPATPERVWRAIRAARRPLDRA